MKIRSLALALILGSVTAAAQAHMLWLEPATNQAQGTRAYFGEYADNLRETQEGPLKAFNQTTASQNGQNYTATAHDNFIHYPTKAQGDVRVAHDMVHGDTLVQFRAKTGRNSTQASSEFEIVPVVSNGNQFKVVLNGQPVAKQEVVIFAPNLWSKTYHTNERGEFSIQAPWPGLYVIESGKEIEGEGRLGEQAYKKRYAVATLSFKTP